MIRLLAGVGMRCGVWRLGRERRFRQTSRLDAAFTALLALVGVALFFYLSHAATAKA